MRIQKKIAKYTNDIWKNQLPPEEESFLYDLLAGKESTNFQYDIDSDYSLFLAHSAQQHGFKGYSDEQIKAFEEVSQIYKAQKLKKIPAISKVLRTLNDNNIIPLLIKGVAFLCYYAPTQPRMMGDIDICIHPDQFDKAMSILYGMGFEYISDTGYHIGITSEKLDIDVHRYIYKNGGDIGSDIYDRLIACSFLGSQVYVLSPEDMLVHQLVNRGQDIGALSHLKRHFKWIVDCYAIMSMCSPDTDSVMEKAISINNLYNAGLTCSKLAMLFPEKLKSPEKYLNNKQYCGFLKSTLKMLKYEKKTSMKSSSVLKYMYLVLVRNWETTKMYKYNYQSNQSIISIMFQKKEIYTIKDFIRRLKGVINRSKHGTIE